MSESFIYSVGLNNVGSFQVSGINNPTNSPSGSNWSGSYYGVG